VKKYLFAVLLLAVVLALVGCFKHTFTVGNGAPEGAVVYDHWHSHWLFGIIGEENVDVHKLCPSGNATIHEETTFVNGLIGAFIGLIYYPTTVTIRCHGGRADATINLTTAQMAALVADPGFISLVEEVAPERVRDARLAQQNAKVYLQNTRLAQAR
jgi:hypothetical protein